MNLVIDIGNSRAKAALFDRGRIVAEQTTERTDELMVRIGPWLDASRPCRAIVASTRGDGGQVAEWLRGRVERVVEFTAETPVPVGIDYLTPATLGRDRLAAAVGAATLYPGRNLLVVDFGTAITHDLVTADGCFRGGVISPGLRLRFRALHDHTAALPLCDAADCGGDDGLLGRTTRAAVARGVVQSVCFETEGYAARLRAEFDDLLIIFAGGDANFFVKRIKNTIFANCNLVLCGLNRILEYDAREEHLD